MIRQIRPNLIEDQQTIIALCTPQGKGGVLALIRLSGLDVFGIVESISKLSSGKKISDFMSHTIHHGFIVDLDNQNCFIDEVLFFLMRGPRTFTGQDTVEISCHNNPFIIEKIIQLACRNGARIAKAGEFSKRAILNNKINLIQAEAINDVIHAQNEFFLKKAMGQMQGTLSHFLMELEADLIQLLGLVETCFEFIEEEQEDAHLNKIVKDKSLEILDKLNKAKINFNQQKQIRDGIKIALIGQINVGKSTLFNALIDQERAIISEIGGTTRDSIESSIYKDGIFWTFIDTAGLRETGDVIEKEGIKRSFAQTKLADLILLIFDISQDLKEQLNKYQQIIDLYKEKVIFIVNKIDKLGFKKSNLSDLLKDLKPLVFVSAKERSGFVQLEKEIQHKVDVIIYKYQSPFLLNQRQARLITEIELKFDFIVKNQLDCVEYELIAYRLKEILEIMSELTGKNVSEEILDSVFKEFCVGK